MQRVRMDHLCLDPGRELFDAHFIYVYPWWLQNQAIKTFLEPLKTTIMPFEGGSSVFCKNIDFLLLLAKFNLIFLTQSPTKINLLPE